MHSYISIAIIMKNAIIIIMAVVVVALGYYAYVNRQIITSGMPTPAAEQGTPLVAEPGAAVYTIVYENNKFTPAALTIKAGDTVVFKNNHSGPISVGSNPHPLHTSFPDFSSGAIASGFNYRFTFAEPVVVNYHNHFNPSVVGQIIVK